MNNNKELLGKFFDGVVKDDAQLMDSIKQVSINVVKQLTAAMHPKNKKLYEGFSKLLLEFNTKYNMNMDIEHNTGVITINGKKVGRVVTNMDDFESGIDFVSADGRFSKEFHTYEDLAKYLYQTYAGGSVR